ncbi:MAG: hypothetical protein V1776_01810 [Candidatus Diapherotrites archaeon]
MMKILDAMSVIAFLKEMKFQEGLEILSKKYELIIPLAVCLEVKKSPEKELLKQLTEKKVVKIVQVDAEKVAQLKKEVGGTLGDGESEAIIYAIEKKDGKKICLVSDDRFARKKFDKTINFKWTERLLEIMQENELITKEVYREKLDLLSHSTFYSRKKK